MDLSWWAELRAWADRELDHTRRVLMRAGLPDPLTYANKSGNNGHGKPLVNRALIVGAQRRRGWTGLRASRAPSPPPPPPATPPTLGEIMAESDARFERGKSLLRRQLEED